MYSSLSVSVRIDPYSSHLFEVHLYYTKKNNNHGGHTKIIMTATMHMTYFMQYKSLIYLPVEISDFGVHDCRSRQRTNKLHTTIRRKNTAAPIVAITITELLEENVVISAG